MKQQAYSDEPEYRQILASDEEEGPAPLDQVSHTYSTWLLRSFIDLGHAADAPLYAQGVDASYENMLAPDSPTLFLQIHPTEHLRANILEQNRLHAYRVTMPGDLPERLWTNRWRRLVTQVDAFSTLRERERVHLCLLLETMGLHAAIAHSLPEPPSLDPQAGPHGAQLAIIVARSRLRLQADDGLYWKVLEMERCLASSSSLDPRARLAACITLLVAFAKQSHRDIAQVEHWRQEALRHTESLRTGESWADTLQASTVWRAVSYAPFLAGDRERTHQELDRAEALAHEACKLADGSLQQRVVSAQNLHPLLETRKREAEWAGDFDLALERARRLVAQDPFDPKVHIHLGDAAWRVAGPEKALSAYRDAVRLGAPYVPLASYRAGNCLEQLGDLASAAHTYVQCLLADPRGFSAAKRLAAMARQLAPPLRAWVEHTLEGMKHALRAHGGRVADGEPRAAIRPVIQSRGNP